MTVRRETHDVLKKNKCVLCKLYILNKDLKEFVTIWQLLEKLHV
jgi:hypothetical protein